jgi:hypothetical protein
VEAEVDDARPYRENRLWRTAEALTAASLLLLLPRRRSRRREMLAGITGTLGSALIKFAVAEAGHTSTKSHSDRHKSG